MKPFKPTPLSELEEFREGIEESYEALAESIVSRAEDIYANCFTQPSFQDFLPRLEFFKAPESLEDIEQVFEHHHKFRQLQDEIGQRTVLALSEGALTVH